MPHLGMVHEDDLARPEQALRDDERSDRVVGDHAAGVPDDVRVTYLQAEDPVQRTFRRASMQARTARWRLGAVGMPARLEAWRRAACCCRSAHR